MNDNQHSLFFVRNVIDNITVDNIITMRMTHNAKIFLKSLRYILVFSNNFTEKDFEFDSKSDTFHINDKFKNNNIEDLTFLALDIARYIATFILEPMFSKNPGIIIDATKLDNKFFVYGNEVLYILDLIQKYRFKKNNNFRIKDEIITIWIAEHKFLNNFIKDLELKDNVSTWSNIINRTSESKNFQNNNSFIYVKNELIIDPNYDEQYFAIFGNTKKYENYFDNMKIIFNSNLTYNGEKVSGWIGEKSKLSIFTKMISMIDN